MVFICSCGAFYTNGILDIYTDVTTPGGYGDEYVNGTESSGWLRPGWVMGSSNTIRIHYDRSRSYFNNLP